MSTQIALIEKINRELSFYATYIVPKINTNEHFRHFQNRWKCLQNEISEQNIDWRKEHKELLNKLSCYSHKLVNEFKQELLRIDISSEESEWEIQRNEICEATKNLEKILEDGSSWKMAITSILSPSAPEFIQRETFDLDTNAPTMQTDIESSDDTPFIAINVRSENSSTQTEPITRVHTILGLEQLNQIWSDLSNFPEIICELTVSSIGNLQNAIQSIITKLESMDVDRSAFEIIILSNAIAAFNDSMKLAFQLKFENDPFTFDQFRKFLTTAQELLSNRVQNRNYKTSVRANLIRSLAPTNTKAHVSNDDVLLVKRNFSAVGSSVVNHLPNANRTNTSVGTINATVSSSSLSDASANMSKSAIKITSAKLSSAFSLAGQADDSLSVVNTATSPNAIVRATKTIPKTIAPITIRMSENYQPFNESISGPWPKKQRITKPIVDLALIKNIIIRCPECGNTRPLYECSAFMQRTLSSRWDFVLEHNICPNCLFGEHDMFECSREGCGQCGELHNSLLCPFEYVQKK